MKIRPRLVMIPLLLVAAATPAALAQLAPSVNVNPESLERMREKLDRQVDSSVTWLARVYQLTEQQKDQVRQRLMELKEEQLRVAPEMERQVAELRDELKHYIGQARQGQQLDPKQMRDVQDRLMSMIEQSPMTWTNIVRETEALLPDDQVMRGRQRQRELQERVDEWKERRQETQTRVPLAADVLKPYLSLEAPDPYGEPPVPKGDRGQAETPGGPGAQPQPTGRGPRIQGPRAAQDRPAEPPQAQPLKLDDWARFVQDFIGQYKLDQGQQTQAWRVYYETRKRADEYQQAHRADYEAVMKIEDEGGELRREELEALDKPLLAMFDDLKARLNNLPTEAQRKEAEAGRTATTRPAATQPTATQPTATAPADGRRVATATQPAE